MIINIWSIEKYLKDGEHQSPTENRAFLLHHAHNGDDEHHNSRKERDNPRERIAVDDLIYPT